MQYKPKCEKTASHKNISTNVLKGNSAEVTAETLQQLFNHALK